MEEKEVKHLSKSSAKTYLDCPFRFYNNYIRGIKGPTPYVFTRGISIHDTLHEAIVLKKPTMDFNEQVNYTKAVFDKMKPFSVVVAEKRMTAEYQDMKLVGLMDIVVKVGDKTIIFDYKSGKEHPLVNYEYELGLYAYILEMNGIKPTHWGIIFVDQQSVKVGEASPTKIAKAVGKTYQVWDDIKEGKFPRKLYKCKWCSLKGACDSLWYQYQEKIVQKK